MNIAIKRTFRVLLGIVLLLCFAGCSQNALEEDNIGFTENETIE